MKLSTVENDRQATKRWLRELRSASGMTQADVAEQLGVSLKTISNMENARFGFPNGYTVIRYLRALGAITSPEPSSTPDSEQALLRQASALLAEVRRRLPPDEEAQAL